MTGIHSRLAQSAPEIVDRISLGSGATHQSSWKVSRKVLDFVQSGGSASLSNGSDTDILST